MSAPSERRTWLVVYDVADDKRRAKMARWFEARGERVQESVFELSGAVGQVARWLEEARKPVRFDPDLDSLRCYGLCGPCGAGVLTWGVGPAPRAPGKAVVT